MVKQEVSTKERILKMKRVNNLKNVRKHNDYPNLKAGRKAFNNMFDRTLYNPDYADVTISDEFSNLTSFLDWHEKNYVKEMAT
jgi:hypothetical protein